MSATRYASVLLFCCTVAVPLGVAGCGKGDRGGTAAAPAADASPDRRTAVDTPLRPVITKIVVEDPSWPDGFGGAPTALEVETLTRQELDAAAVFARGTTGSPDFRPVDVTLKVQVGAEHEPGKVARPKTEAQGPHFQAVVLLRLWAPGDEDFSLEENVLAEIPATGRDDAARATALRALVERALHDGLASLIAKEKVRQGNPKELLAALDSKDPDLRAMAFATVAERRLASASPRLLELLDSPDPLVRDGAIGALVALRERRAVEKLTRMAKFEDHDTMRRIIDAIGAIGGDEARAYLEFVAGGHDHPIIRELAKEALARLERLEGKTQAAAGATPNP